MELLDLLNHDVRKPARYRGGEFFPAGYQAPKEGDLKVALVYPDLYEIGMSNTGLRILYSMLVRLPGVYVDLAFTPWPDMEAALRKSGERLTSRHGNIPLADFDVLGFSLQFELNYTNVLTVLDLAGLPLLSAERGESSPLVIAGGPCATHCEPMVPFLDAVLPGDGEESITRFVEAVRESISKESGRSDLLKALDLQPGTYVPKLHEPTEGGGRVLVHDQLAIPKETLRNLDKFDSFTEFPVPAVETVFDRISLELARGCFQGCRFCEQGFTYRPPRERSLEYLMGWAGETIDSSGLNEISLASLSSADYSCILPLASQIRTMAQQKDASVAVSSLRAYGIDDTVLDALTDRRTSSLTLAPEAGSQRLRDLINKNVTREQILDAVRRIVDKRINRIKLYFMLGLPTETDQDIEELCQLVHDCYDIVRARFKGKAAVVASTSMFVPRPHTPFQWEGMVPVEQLQEKVATIRDRLRRKGITVRWHDPEMSWLEAVITRGDRTLAPAIEEAYRLGARFDSWDELFKQNIWRDALAATGIDGNRFLKEIPTDQSLPWSHFKIDVDDEFLRRERERAFEFKLTKPCQPFGDKFVCYQCGAECEDPRVGRRPLVASLPGSPSDCDLTSVPRRAPPRSLRPDCEALPGNSSHPTKAPSDRPAAGQLPHGNDSTHLPRAPSDRPAAGQLPHGKALLGRPPDQIEATRYRLTYRKVGDAVLLGHLDILRQLTLTMRRAGLSVERTKGFNPRPRFYFALPLALGHFALAEPVDIIVHGKLDQSEALELLNRYSIPGVECLSWTEVVEGMPKVSRVVEATILLAPSNADAPALTKLIKALDSEHLKGLEIATDIPSELPDAPAGVVRIHWSTISAPRIDKVLAEAHPELEWHWICREKLGY